MPREIQTMALTVLIFSEGFGPTLLNMTPCHPLYIVLFVNSGLAESTRQIKGLPIFGVIQ